MAVSLGSMKLDVLVRVPGCEPRIVGELEVPVTARRPDATASRLADLHRAVALMAAVGPVLDERRARLVDEVAERYGVRLHLHPRRPHVAVVSQSDYELLVSQVMEDRRIDALGRGYYLGLGGELTLQSAPDWTCDADAIVQARLVGSLRQAVRPALDGIDRFLEAIANVGRRL